MDLELFVSDTSGRLVEIRGSDPRTGSWEHRAFVPHPLPTHTPTLSTAAHLATNDARAALATLDSTARHLPNPTLLRRPALRREAHSTSALEGTYAPLSEVLAADEASPGAGNIAEILDYEVMANEAFGWVLDGRPLTTGLLVQLQGILMRNTPLAGESGRLRQTQVLIGRRAGLSPDAAAVHAARFVPAPPDDRLTSGIDALLGWLRADHSGQIDPVVAAAMSHYQFETLHPFRDGNGRLGRLLIVLHLLTSRVLSEPTLTVSPWFEARRDDYYDALFSVSARGDWNTYIEFFARGLQAAADSTKAQMLDLVAVQAELKEHIRSSNLRADSAHAVVDIAVANPSFTVRRVQSELGVTYARANGVVRQLVSLELLKQIGTSTYNRRFYAPQVMRVLLDPPYR